MENKNNIFISNRNVARYVLEVLNEFPRKTTSKACSLLEQITPLDKYLKNKNPKKD